MKFRRNAIAIFALSLCALAQDAPLTQETIIQMSRVGLPDDVIVSKVRSEARPPKISADDLIALKSAGVSDAVLRALVSPAPASDPPATSPAMSLTVAIPDTNDPMAPHDAGIYMLRHTEDGRRKLVLMERAGAGNEKTANIWAYVLSYGIAKIKTKAQIPGPHAALRTGETNPVFYMYFPATGNLGAGDAISSPSQFSLLLLEEVKDHRETAVASYGMGGASTGNDDKMTVKLNTEKIRPYSYMVTPAVNLKPGEYAFVAASGVGGSGSTGSVMIFDFGVDAR